MSNVIVCLQEERATGFNHELIFDSGSPPAFRCFFLQRAWMVVWIFDLPKMFCLFLKSLENTHHLEADRMQPRTFGEKKSIHWGGETAMTAAQRELWEAHGGPGGR